MTLDYKKLKEVAEKATPGPWIAVRSPHMDRVCFHNDARSNKLSVICNSRPCSAKRTPNPQHWMNIQYIAACDPMKILRLLRIIEIQTEALEKCGGPKPLVGYAFDGNHQPKSLFDEMVLRRGTALKALEEVEKIVNNP